MVLLGLLLAGLAVGALVNMDSDDESVDATPEGETAVDGQLIEGDELDNTLTGTNGSDLLAGYGDEDRLVGRGGDDILLGGEDGDTLLGRTGDDLLVGGDHDDNLRGGQGDDTLIGSAGNDLLMGGEGNDVLAGADITNRDLVVGDFLSPDGSITDYYYEVPTEPEANRLYGEEGNDDLLLGENDTATGGEGSDMFEIGEWIDEPDKAPLITDFNGGEDILVVRYAQGTPAPVVTIEEDGEDRNILADGNLIARVQVDDIPPEEDVHVFLREVI